MADERYESTRQFLEQLDSGELDRNLATELKKLSRTQLEELASILVERAERTPSS